YHTYYIRSQWPNLTLIYLAYKMKFQIYYIDAHERASTEKRDKSSSPAQQSESQLFILFILLLVMMTYLLFLVIFFVIFPDTFYGFFTKDYYIAVSEVVKPDF
ncbi:unnamed protein product, partial [Prunus brigantina]